MKRLKLSQTDIETICFPFLKDIEENHFQVYLTKGGNVAIILNRTASKDYPILGAYYTGTEWLPSRWSEKGKFNIGVDSLLDLRMNTGNDKEVA